MRLDKTYGPSKELENQNHHINPVLEIILNPWTDRHYLAKTTFYSFEQINSS
jgi:hypothetical protein